MTTKPSDSQIETLKTVFKKQHINRAVVELATDPTRTVSQLARREKVSIWAIYKRRRRLEAKVGIIFPRYNKAGRKPIIPSPTPIECV